MILILLEVAFLHFQHDYGITALVLTRLSFRMQIMNGLKFDIYRNVIFRVALYGCETWSFALRGECRLRVFENGMLRRLFGPKKDEASGEWRRLHNEEFYAVYSSPNIIRGIKSRRLGWACSM